MGGRSIAILGCGYMGTALLIGLLKKGDKDNFYTAHVTNSASADRIESQLVESDRDRVKITYGQSKVVQAVADADLIVIGVQPGDLQTLLGTSGLVELLEGKTVISILAGVSASEVVGYMTRSGSRPAEALKVARIIPTLGATQGDSVTLLADFDGCNGTEWYTHVEEFLSQIGTVVRVPERLMNSATAIGAAVHALAIVAIDTVTDASVAAGVPRDVAKVIAAESLRSGCGLMAGKAAMSPERVKTAMSTPGGITMNAIVDLDKSARSAIALAVRSAIDYTTKMGR